MDWIYHCFVKRQEGWAERGANLLHYAVHAAHKLELPELGEWISLEKGERLRGCSFSGPEGFLEFRKEQKTEIVLLGTGFWEDVRILEQIKEPGKEEGEEERNVCPEN